MSWTTTPRARKPGNKSFYLYGVFRQSNLCSMPGRAGAMARRGEAASDLSYQSCSLPYGNKSRAFVHIDKGGLGKGWRGKKEKSRHSSCFSRPPSPYSVNEKKTGGGGGNLK